VAEVEKLQTVFNSYVSNYRSKAAIEKEEEEEEEERDK
jgi:hypothetical protein